jgi:hypothetical protein
MISLEYYTYYSVIWLNSLLVTAFTQNVDNRNIIQFVKNNSPRAALGTGYNQNYIKVSVNVKILCLQVDKNLNWTNQSDKLFLSQEC